MLNPIELAWSGLKDYVRKNNTSFILSDVRKLTQRWIASLDANSAAAYIQHTRAIEETFEKSDQFIKQIEEEIIDDDEEMDSETEDIVGWI